MKSVIISAEGSSSSSLFPVSRPPPLQEAIISGVKPSESEREGWLKRVPT